MKHLLLVYYAIAVFSGLIGFSLVFLMISQGLKRLALVYGTLITAFSLLIGSVLLQTYWYVILKEIETPEKLWVITLVIFFSKVLFLLGFGWIVLFLFFEKPRVRWLGILDFASSVLGGVFLMTMFLQGFSQERLRWLLFVDQWIWGSIMVVSIGHLLVLLWFRLRRDLPPMLIRVIRILVILTVVFLPLFVVDTLWELFQVTWRILPRYFNFSSLYYMGWNFLTLWYLLSFLAERNLWLAELVQPVPQKVDGIRLSQREREIVGLLLHGEDNRSISSQLYITEHTVRNYISKLYEKTGTTNRVQLVQKLSRFINT